MRRRVLGLVTIFTIGCGAGSAPANDTRSDAAAARSDSGGGAPLDGPSDSTVPGDGALLADAASSGPGDDGGSESLDGRIDDGGSESLDGSVGDGAALPPALTWTLEFSGSPVRSVWGSGPNDVYGVGTYDLIVHSTGNGVWTPQSSGTNGVILYGVWGSGPNDVYVAPGINTMLHSTGDGGWTHEGFSSGVTFRGVWGSGPNDVYTYGATYHWTSAGWTAVTLTVGSEPVLAMWGSSSTDIYAGGDFGNVYHFDGSYWRPQMVVPVAQALSRLTGSGPNDIYVSDGTSVYHSTGDGNWPTQSIPLASNDGVYVLFAVSATAVYAVTSTSVLRSAGDGTWVAQAVSKLSLPFAMWGSSPTDLYIATEGGILHGTL
jgi:hypothetical protein